MPGEGFVCAQPWEIGKALSASRARMQDMLASVLIVEDDADLSTIMATRLSKAGYGCTQAYSGTEAALRLEAHAFDLVVTDLMLPGASGEELVGAIRAQGSHVPVLVTSARAASADKVALLRLGADDYLAKPFDLDELEARVAALLRRAGKDLAAQGTGLTAALCAGRWRIDREARIFSVDGRDIPLTRIEFNILELLASHPRKVFTKAELYELAWGEPYAADDSTVNTHISNIRAKLRSTGADSYIQTVWGLGFKLNAS